MNEFRKRLRDIGMEKEFSNWIKDITLKQGSKIITVGDRVICVDPPHPEYKGKKGRLIRIEKDEDFDMYYHIDFDDKTLEGAGWYPDRFRRL